MATREIAANKPDGCIPLTVGIRAQPNPQPGDVEHLQNQLQSLLADLGQEYSHTPIVLLTVEGDITAAKAATGTERMLQTLPSSCDKHISQCSVLITLQD